MPNDFAEEDMDTKRKKEVQDTRGSIDAVDELISLINPKLKKSLDDAAKNKIRPNR